MDISEAGAMRPVYEKFWAQHAAALRRYAFGLTGDEARAEDVVRQTLLWAWQHPEVVDDTTRSARGWLFTVARNMVIDDLRSARSPTEVISPDGWDAPQPTGCDDINAALDRTLVADAMALLAAEHRVVLRHSYYDGRTTAQIAADLGIAEGTVTSRLHYALRSLRQTLQHMGMQL